LFLRRVIVIVISRFLQRPQKISRWNQLIHRRLSKTKSIGGRVKIQSQADLPGVGVATPRYWAEGRGVAGGGRRRVVKYYYILQEVCSEVVTFEEK